MHQQMQQMQVREARYLSSPGGSLKGGQKPCAQGVATLCPSFAYVAQAANSGNKRPFLHFKAASFSTPSLRVMIWGLVQPRQGSR
jgi:hypothetical protein